jgi:hypothetical protein
MVRKRLEPRSSRSSEYIHFQFGLRRHRGISMATTMFPQLLCTIIVSERPTRYRERVLWTGVLLIEIDISELYQNSVLHLGCVDVQVSP